MKYVTCLLLVLSTTPCLAQTDTDELLGAPNARTFIQLWPEFDKSTFNYSIDADKSRKHYKSLVSTPTIGVPRRAREVALTIRFYNPLQYTIRTTDTLLQDPSYYNIGQFATALTNFLKQLPSVAEHKKSVDNKLLPGDSGGEKVTTPALLSRYSLKTAGQYEPTVVQKVNSLINDRIRLSATPPTTQTLTLPNGTTASVPTALYNLVEYVNKLGYEDLAEWKFLLASGRLGCLDVKADVMKNLTVLDDRYYNGAFRVTVITALDKLSRPDNVKEFKAVNTWFKTQIDSLKRVNETNQQTLKNFDNAISGDIYKLLLNTPINPSDEAVCKLFVTYSQMVFKRMVRACLDGQRKRDQILELADQLTNEITRVEEAVDATFGDDDGGYHAQNAIILGRYTIHDRQMHEIGVLMRKRRFNFNMDPPVLVESNEKIVGKVKIRSSQTFIPEYSFGLYFTNFFYPVYSTRTITAEQARTLNDALPKPASVTYLAGQTLVDDVVNQQVPVVAAAMLNLTINAFDGLTHPFFQVGVGTGKTLPTFLMGGGVRFRWDVPIMISAGAIWNWKKQFTNLKVGQIIDGAADLERDLHTEFDPKPRFYLGIQLHL